MHITLTIRVRSTGPVANRTAWSATPLPDRVCDRRGIGNGDRYRSRLGQWRHDCARRRIGVFLRLSIDPAAAAGSHEPGQAATLALAADTASTTVRIVDNGIMLVIPGVMTAYGLASPLFWGSLALSLAVAAVAAFPVNRWLIGRGKGHAVVRASFAL